MDSADPSSYRVSSGDATFFPIFFPNGERPAITVQAPRRPPVWSIKDPKISGSNTTVYRPALPGFGDRARAAMRPAFRPAFSGLNWENFVAQAIPWPLDSRDTRARMDEHFLATSNGVEEVLVLVLPKGPRAFLRALVRRATNRRLDVLAPLVQGEDLRIRPHARVPERSLRDSGIVGILLGTLRDLHEAFDGRIQLSQVLDVAREHQLVVDQEDGRRRLAPSVADDGFVLREPNLVRAVRDDIRDCILTAEADCLLDDPGGYIFHRITSGTRSGVGS